MLSLVGRVAIVTGAAAGIGKEIATLLWAHGASIVLVDRDTRVREVAVDIDKGAGRTLPVILDICSFKQLDTIVSKSIQTFGRIDILVNNAGIGPLQEAELLSEENWDRTLAVNLKAPFMLAQAVAKTMIAQRSGRIINIASQAALIALDQHAAYSASKAGLVGMSRVLALEWGEFNINVNCISPTVILTELGKKAWGGEAGEAMKKKIPLGRFGEPKDVAACVLFLASDAASMITGENLVIDGGYTIQ